MRLSLDRPLFGPLALGALLLAGVAVAACDKECDCETKSAAAIQDPSSSPGASAAATAAAAAGACEPTPAKCDALFARVASDRSFEGIQGTVENGADETRTISPQGGSKITVDRDGNMKLVDPAGRRVALRPDGTVEEANYDVLLVAPDGSRRVYWASKKTVVSFEEYTQKLAETAEESGEEGTDTAAARSGKGAGDDTGKDKGKVTICHVPPGNPANQHTLTVSASAVDAHLRHGDYRGPCTGAGAKGKGQGKGSGSDKGKSQGKGQGKGKGKKK